MKELRALAYGALVFAVVIAAVLGILWAVGAEYQDAPEADYSQTDEAITADVGNWTPVDAPDDARSFYDDETVTNSSGATLSEGTDYEWNTSTGELYWYDTSSVSDGEQMAVDYNYSAPTQTARNLKTVLDVPLTIVFPIAGLIVVAFTVAGLGVGVYQVLAKSGGSTAFNRR